MMSDIFERLAAEFPRDAIHWRAQTLTQSGDKALALAYLDARDVMDRLDDVCGPGGWTNSYVETPKGRVIATISIKVGDEWISKSDGAGDTAVEGEKGGVSDALKRAAVCWGIGRYLYRLPNVWAPCESYERSGKKHWKAWKGSPWDQVRGYSGPVNTAQADASLQLALDGIAKCETQAALKTWWDRNAGAVPDHHLNAIKEAANTRKQAIKLMDTVNA
jgi:hypothetical protein